MDERPSFPRRVSICGSSGSGKSTLGKRLARVLDVPFIELDALYHRPNWEETPRPEFIAKVAPIAETEGWVIDGNYSYVREFTWARADTIVFLDYAYALVWCRIVKRTLRRGITKEELWNGNREQLSRALFTRDSIIWWMMRTWHKQRRNAIATVNDPNLAGVSVHRFRSPRETEAWVRGLEASVLPCSRNRLLG